MNVSPINSTNTSVSPNFKANLWVDKSVEKIIESNKSAFSEAAEKCDKWLRTEKKNILSTMTIRKNTALSPKVAFRRMITETTYAYPHEESGYTYTHPVNAYEDLEFELNNRKCGFWFDKESDAEKLFSDFKNMFNYLLSDK